jgi:uncharacterized membrane protein YfcA
VVGEKVEGEVVTALGLIALGFGTGAYGTLIGAGGGFVLVPILLLLYPQAGPHLITSISLAVVFFNAVSGSEAYAMMGRIDYRTGLLFAIATIPGAVLGALTTGLLPRRLFDIAFGVLLVAAATYLVWRSARPDQSTQRHGNGSTTRRLVEADGTEHTYSFSMPLGMFLSLFVGYLSSLFGIGGGIFHVTLLTSLLNFPIHIATATSHFILAVMALAGTATHIATGTFAHGVHRTIYLSIGVLIGAQVGARLSNRLRGVWIIRSLAIALGGVGIRLMLMS